MAQVGRGLGGRPCRWLPCFCSRTPAGILGHSPKHPGHEGSGGSVSKVRHHHLCWVIVFLGQGTWQSCHAILNPIGSSIPCWPHSEITERMFHKTWAAVCVTSGEGELGWVWQGSGMRDPIILANMGEALTLCQALYRVLSGHNSL